MRAFLFFLSAYFIIGCASSQPYKKWEQDLAPLVQSGQMKQSDYYKQLYAKALAENFPTKPTYLDRVGVLIAAAEKLEAGQMSQSQFDEIKRRGDVAIAQNEGYVEAANAEQRRRVVEAINQNTQQQAQQPYYKVVQPAPFQTPTMTRTNCTPNYGGGFNCTTQ